MRYCVLTYLFGCANGYKDKLHEPLVLDSDTEYICVTDDKTLIDPAFTIIYDESYNNIQQLRYKFAQVKYNPFKYTSADIVVVMDATMQVRESIKPLCNEVCLCDIGLKKHPVRQSIDSELSAWVEYRGMSESDKTNCLYMNRLLQQKSGYYDEIVYETNVMVMPNTAMVRRICNATLSLMRVLGRPHAFMSNQIPLSMLMNTAFKKSSVFYIDQLKYFNRYGHNTSILVE